MRRSRYLIPIAQVPNNAFDKVVLPFPVVPGVSYLLLESKPLRVCIMSISPSLISELRSLLPNVQIVTPSSPDYAHAIHQWNFLSILPAGAIAYPTTSGQVSIFVSFASQHNLDLATRCDGHGSRGTSSTSGASASIYRRYSQCLLTIAGAK
jgi:hypothetical protein